MPGETEQLPVLLTAAVLGAGTLAVPGEPLGRVWAALPVVGGPAEREQVLVSAWLTRLRSTRTRGLGGG